MARISSKQIDFGDGISGGIIVSGSLEVSGSLNVFSPGSGSFAYISSSGEIRGETGSFDYITITGDLVVDDITITGGITTALSASSFIFVDSDQKLNTVTPTDGQLMIYTGSAFVATNRIDGGTY